MPDTSSPPASAPPTSVRVIKISPASRRPLLDLPEIWQYRDVIYMLALRDIRLRYKQTLLGATWALLQPIAASGVLAGVFGALVGGESLGAQETPYFLFLLAGMIPWQLFASGLEQAGDSLVANQQLVTKVYFPRIALPIASLVFALVDFSVAAAILAVLQIIFGGGLHWTALLWPFCGIAIAFCAFSVALWVSALNAVFRDFRYALPFVIRMLMFMSPVVFATDALVQRIPVWAEWLFRLNPMVGMIELFRWTVAGGSFPSTSVLWSTAVIGVLLVGGLYCFRAMERVLADVV